MNNKKHQLFYFPRFVPELIYRPEEFTKPFKDTLILKLKRKLFRDIKIDDDGLVFFVKGNKKKLSILASMTYALSNYNYYIDTGEQKYLVKFEKICCILIKNFYIEKIVNGGMLGGFIEPSRNKLYGYPKPIESFSALTNARALSLLARYYFLVHNDWILSKIDHILNIFEYLSDEEGVLKKNNDNFWYLEYSYGNNSPVVFNGFLSALIGLYDIHEVFKDQNNEELSFLTKKSKKLFDCGFETLLKNINKIEYHNNLLNFRWLKYDDNKLFFADSHYFILKLNQIKTLYEYVKNPVLEKTHKRWRKIYKKNRTKATVFEFLYQLYKLLTFIEDKVRNDEK